MKKKVFLLRDTNQQKHILLIHSIIYLTVLLFIGLGQGRVAAITIDSAKNLLVATEAASHVPIMLGFFESQLDYGGTHFQPFSADHEPI